jgi:hypothetical protein
MFKSHLIKLNHKAIKNNRNLMSTCFAHDYSGTVLAAKMCTKPIEHFIYIRFLR